MARRWLSAAAYDRAICLFAQPHGNLRDAHRSFSVRCVVEVVSSRRLALCHLRQVHRPRSRNQTADSCLENADVEPPILGPAELRPMLQIANTAW